MHSLIKPVLPEAAGPPRRWGRLHGSAAALAVTQAAWRHTGPVLLICGDPRDADRLEAELRFYGNGALPVFHLPDWETLPYDVFSPHQDIVSRRLEVLYRVTSLDRGVVVVPANTLIQRLPPRPYVTGGVFMLEPGDRVDTDGMRAHLDAAGYTSVPQVMEHGEFAVRGSIIDIFPMGGVSPFRIDLFDDEIDSIRTFDPESQLSRERVARIRLLPGREFPLDDAAVRAFRQRYRARFEGDPRQSLIYRDVSNGLAPGGIEYYLPLFFDRTASLPDYLPQATLVVQTEDADAAMASAWDQARQRYQQRSANPERPLLQPHEVFLSPEQVTDTLAPFPRVLASIFEQTAGADAEIRVSNLPAGQPPRLLLNPRAREPAAELQRFLKGFRGRVLFAVESAGRREAALRMLADQGIHPHPVDGWEQFLQAETTCGICVAPLEQGLLLEEPPLAIIAESQLYGDRPRPRRRPRPVRDPEAVIRDLGDLSVGAPVVHEQHGVGRYRGLQTLVVNGAEAEFLALEYAGGDKLYVPVASLHLVSRYTGAAPEQAPLHRLGGDQWARARKRAAEKVRDVAAELLDIQARRAARPGNALHWSEADYRAFASEFPFEETPDQQHAIDQVLEDLRADRSMDRVVCGDVGFGKTEVAMRAAFVVASAGRQVAVLVPTTLLAQQHYQTFRDRFADWPLRIEALSRLRGRRQQEQALAGLADGQVDIVIGTHKLLQKDVRFARLGLVIVDEEHRFGVRHKEALKRLRAEVDLLTLTATPIPRTLNMSLAGLRDLSLIATPPAERLAVKTFVSQWDDALVQEACLREIKRGGQVYFLHNKVESINGMAERLRRLVPEAHVEVAHGQMRESELEHVMLDFYHRRFNILVCTTIIESGIDVPTANTILINRADHFGLAQLHQLRGRVGRSHHRAYAYLLVPARSVMTPDAVKRLEALESLEELGAGFTLATHDLEIRGAGELLGEEQSGQIQEIGFGLYTELLERAVHALKSGRLPELADELEHGPELELHVPTLLPADYIPDVHLRLVLYKRVASARDEEALEEIQVELIDRFGLLPNPTKNLFRVTALKLRCASLGIRRLEAGPNGGRISFTEHPDVDPAAIIRLVQNAPQIYRLDGQTGLRFRDALAESEQRFVFVERLLDRLGAHSGARSAVSRADA